jgi:hypothetical protein
MTATQNNTEVQDNTEEITFEIPDVLTPYEGAKYMTAMLAEAGIVHEVKGPMVYIYARKGAFGPLVRAMKDTKKGQQEVWNIQDKAAFIIWADGHVKKMIAKFQKNS